MESKIKVKDPVAHISGRVRNLERLKESAARGDEKLAAFPAVLYLEAAAACNLRCPMCPSTIGLPREPYRTDLFDPGLLPKIEPALDFAVRCFLSGGGEPLLHPRFFELVRFVKKHGVEVYFNSNATLMDEARAREIIAAGVDTISISFDGAIAETYERVRKPASFERTAANIRRLAELKKKACADRPFLNMQFTALDLNRQDITKIAPLAASLGINHLVIEPLTPVYCFDPEYRAYYEAHVLDPAAVGDDVRKAAEQARGLGLVFSSHYLFAAGQAVPAGTCVEPWLTFGVRVDGRVFSCCGMLDSMGDLSTQSFEEIWNGPAYRSLRRALAAHEFPDCCSWCVAENRANHFNEDLLRP